MLSSCLMRVRIFSSAMLAAPNPVEQPGRCDRGLKRQPYEGERVEVDGCEVIASAVEADDPVAPRVVDCDVHYFFPFSKCWQPHPRDRSAARAFPGRRGALISHRPIHIKCHTAI